MLGKLKRTEAYAAFKERKKALQRWASRPWNTGNAFRCPVCGSGLRRFKPIWKSYVRKLQEYGFVHPLSAFETFNAEAYTCPACDASDRERLYALYLEERFSQLQPGRKYTFIDFAPSPALSRKLRTNPLLNYRTADLLRANVDDTVDISNMTIYGDASVDIFLCSHILEHVPDDRRAMRELRRVLRPDGVGLVMVPLIIGVDETREDAALNTPEQRWKHYCQDDHLRLYGRRDFIARLEAAGLRVSQLGIEHFGAEAFRRAGVHSNSILYVVAPDTERRSAGESPT
jgi:SAM-dependent methyltransferase